MFKNENVNNSVKTSAMAGFYKSVEWQNHCFDLSEILKIPNFGCGRWLGKTILILCHI